MGTFGNLKNLSLNFHTSEELYKYEKMVIPLKPVDKDTPGFEGIDFFAEGPFPLFMYLYGVTCNDGLSL